jgi:hypothetical protein
MTSIAVGHVSLGIDEAARLSGLSRASIERALRSGELIAHYPTARPLILVEDLRAWIEAAPTQRRAP